MRRLLLSALFPFALAAQTPCLSPLAPKITPCKATTDEIVATIDGQPIKFADLDEDTRKSMEGLESKIAEARKQAAREEMDDVLLAREAARRNASVGQLIYNEVVMKTARPTEEDVKREIESRPNRYKRGAEDSEWAAGNLFDRRLEAREKAFIASLKKPSPLKLEPGAHVEAAALEARISALEDQKTSVDRIVHDRLLAAEAKKRGVTPEELTRTEVTAKVTKKDDGFEEWELGQKFDARLREGHDIKLLFVIPKRPMLAVDDPHSPQRGSGTVTLVEFGDFECPPCGKMWPIVEQALEPFGDRVRYVFRQNPLSMHPRAWKAAEAALAANAQGKFFPYAQILFAHQNALDVASLKKYAREAGLDAKQFDGDLDSGRFGADVAADKHAGSRAGVIGTPMFFINGVRGGDEVYSLEGMRAAIDAELKQSAAAATQR